jgi:hypothetical protein
VLLELLLMPPIPEIQAIHPESEVLSIEGHGASFWTRTARVETKLKDGSSKACFLKVSRLGGWRNYILILPLLGVELERRPVDDARGVRITTQSVPLRACIYPETARLGPIRLRPQDLFDPL